MMDYLANFIMDNTMEYEFDIGSDDPYFFIWIPFMDLEEFVQIAGPEHYEENAIDALMLEDSICVNICKIYDIKSLSELVKAINDWTESD